MGKTKQNEAVSEVPGQVDVLAEWAQIQAILKDEGAEVTSPLDMFREMATELAATKQSLDIATKQLAERGEGDGAGELGAVDLSARTVQFGEQVVDLAVLTKLWEDWNAMLAAARASGEVAEDEIPGSLSEFVTQLAEDYHGMEAQLAELEAKLASTKKRTRKMGVPEVLFLLAATHRWVKDSNPRHFLGEFLNRSLRGRDGREWSMAKVEHKGKECILIQSVRMVGAQATDHKNYYWPIEKLGSFELVDQAVN